MTHFYIGGDDPDALKHCLGSMALKASLIITGEMEGGDFMPFVGVVQSVEDRGEKAPIARRYRVTIIPANVAGLPAMTPTKRERRRNEFRVKMIEHLQAARACADEAQDGAAVYLIERALGEVRANSTRRSIHLGKTGR
jgi:hypothetical protein